MPELLLELLSEEIPARMQPRARDDLKRLVTDALDKAGFDHQEPQAFATPRRLTVAVDGLPERQPDTREERRGPKVGSPDQAVQGFLRSAGLESLEECEVREAKGVEYYFAVIERSGEPTAQALARLIPEVVRSLNWPKSMRWRSSKGTYVRPLRNILCTFDGWPLDGGVDFGGGVVLDFTPKTQGHRFLAPDEVLVKDFKDYQEKLRRAYVVLDPAERRTQIRDKAAKVAAKRGFTVQEDEALLDEVAGLVEWPEPLLGSIDDVYMDLPPEVLVTSMRTHQKYFSVINKDGNMAPRFVVVANMVTPDKGAAIVAGNERVLRARLADAKFFWDQDRKRRLSSRATELSDITYHARLGTLDAKVDRIESLAVTMTDYLPQSSGLKDKVRSAARLAKADLTTGMVGEFPELQGIMGRYYAQHDGEDADVAEAIADHYAPQGPGDRCPRAPVSVALALADKVDTLAGFFAIGEMPTGSRDPYALRRAALGIIRLILENGLRMPLGEVFTAAMGQLSRQVQSIDAKSVIIELLDFFAERLKVHLREQGVRHDLIGAIFGQQRTNGREDDLVRLLARVEALRRFLDSEDGANLLVAYRRAANIVRIEEKKDNASYDRKPAQSVFELDEEISLHGALVTAAEESDKAFEKEDYEGAMTALAALRTPVDAFFDKVTVNVENKRLRENRLRLLSQIRDTMDRLADFSRIEG